MRRKWNERKFGACGLFAKALLNQFSINHAGRPKPHSWGPDDVRNFCIYYIYISIYIYTFRDIYIYIYTICIYIYTIHILSIYILYIFNFGGYSPVIKHGNKKSVRRNGYLNGNTNFRSWATAWFQSAVGFRTKNIGMSCNDLQSDKILKRNESIVDLGIEVLLLTCNTVANAGTSQSITEPCHAAIPVMQCFQTSRAESCIQHHEVSKTPP